MRNVRITICLAGFSCLFLTSCAPSKLFYWGDYSHTAYNLKKNPDSKHREAHKRELLEIMEKSKKRKLKVPPGVYCEYGYLMYQDGNSDEALKYFELEETTYPESRTFTHRLRMMVSGEKPAAPSVESEGAGDASEASPVHSPMEGSQGEGE